MKKNLKILSVMLLSVLVLGVVGCGGSSASPKGTVESFVAGLQKLDVNAMKATVTNPDELGSADALAGPEIQMMKPVFAALQLTDVQEKTEGEKATVTAKLSALDFTKAFPLVLEKLADVGEADFEKKFAEELGKLAGSKDAPKVTNDVVFNLKKEGDKWLIDTKETNMEAVMGAALGGMM